jgi:hypothetical protein
MAFNRCATALLVFALASALPALAAITPEQNAAMAPIRQFTTGFNRGDMKMAVAACDSPASVLDDFSPHIWQGATACADWAKAFVAAARASKLTGGVVTMGAPWQVSLTGDRGYAVIPVTYTYKLAGKPVTESGSVWTLALRKASSGWVITAWAWAQR